MTSASFEVEGVDEFIRELGAADGRIDMGARVDVRNAGQRVTSGWKRHTRQTAGGYAKHYIAAIEPELIDDGLGVVIGPIKGKPQADMVFEYGGPSVARRGGWPGAPFYAGAGKWIGGPRVGQRVGQNAPHLDMNVTMDHEEPKFIVALEKTVAKAWR